MEDEDIGDDGYTETLKVREMEAHRSPELPAGVALGLHPSAIVPNRLGSVERPYLVRFPQGLVAVKIEDRIPDESYYV